MLRFFALAVAILSLIPARAEDPTPAISMGPLRKIDPSAAKLEGLIRVHGDSSVGLPGAAGQRMQRIGDSDEWLVESGNWLVRLGLDRAQGKVRLREILVAEPEWCLSPDGKLLFARRLSPDFRREVCECFDLTTGESLWTVPDGWEAADVIFSHDGKAVILLHGRKGSGGDADTFVTWHDARSGETLREVSLSSMVTSISGDVSDYLAEIGRNLYVSVPTAGGQECWSIPLEGGEPVALSWQAVEGARRVSFQIGGRQREFLAVVTRESVEFHRKSPNGELEFLATLKLASQSSFQRNIRFTPDQKHLLVADCETTRLVGIPTRPGDILELKSILSGTALGDFTHDGKAFISVDNGGGVVRNPRTFERADRAALQENPEHCCPVTDAGFSIGGRWIISSDERSLLLWSREGEMLAELRSPNDDSKRRIEMQSPLIIDRLLKVYAADGWNFLEWDLKEVAERRKKLPGFQPRVLGKVVFPDLKATGTEPAHMTLGTDSTGKKLVTAISRNLIYRALDEPEKTTLLQAADRDVYMRPREFHIPDADGEIVLRSAGEVLALDPLGKNPPRALGYESKATAPRASRHFVVSLGQPSQDALEIVARSFGSVGAYGETDERISVPGWRMIDFRVMCPTPDGRWLLVANQTPRREHVAELGVIDWETKRLVRRMPLPFSATTLEISPDGKRLLMGASNRSVYEFDVEALCRPDGQE